jgi:drug/metabolite transporter (DMT)-like permease
MLAEDSFGHPRVGEIQLAVWWRVRTVACNVSSRLVRDLIVDVTFAHNNLIPCSHFVVVQSTSGFAYPLAMVGAVKCARFVAILSAYTYLHALGLPVLSFVWLLLIAAAVILNVLYKPWMMKRQVVSGDWPVLILYALLLAGNFVFFCEGLKYYGPLRTVMTADYSDLAVAYLVGALFGRFSIHEDKIKGAFVMAVAYALIFMIDPYYVVDEPLWARAHVRSAAAAGAVDRLPHTFELAGLVAVPEKFVGGVAIALAVVLTIARKSVAMRVAPRLGSERLFTLGVTLAAVLLTPVAVYQFVRAQHYWPAGVFAWSTPLWLLVIAALAIALDFYIEIYSTRTISSAHMARTSLAASFVTACVVGVAVGAPPSLLSLVLIAMLFLGFFLFYSESHARATALPLYAAVGNIAPPVRVCA